MWYNTLVRHQLTGRLPVYSVLMLLRPSAHADDQTGVHQVLGVHGEVIHEFRYTVIRVWQEPITSLLAAGPAFAPLALLTDEAQADLPAAFGRFAARLRQPDVPATVGGAALGNGFVLCGLRYDLPQFQELFMSLESIVDDSVSAQWLIRKGEAKGMIQGQLQAVRQMLLRLGQKRFGAEPNAEPRLNAMTDLSRLERMADRVLDAASWDDLLATP
jgi:hypothetical protein